MSDPSATSDGGAVTMPASNRTSAPSATTRDIAADSQPESPFWPTTTTPLSSFLEKAYVLTSADFEILTDQAIVLLDQLYVHLPVKRASRGIDPVQRLKLLRHRLPNLTQRQFHDEMISIFASLHDLHTNFILPSPFAGKSALLPFIVEEYVEQQGDARVRRFVVSKVVTSFADETFKPGVIVTHWNGVPIDRAIEINGARQLTANAEAERARGLLTLTIRPLTRTAPPDEMWVDVEYITEEGSHKARRFTWVVADSPPPAFTLVAAAGDDVAPAAIGVDYDLEIINQLRKQLYGSSASESQVRAATATFTPTGAFRWHAVPTATGPYGYVRIWTFSVDRVNDFINELRSIVAGLPQQGLIIDVRGNGGGKIVLADQILQWFTPGPIETVRYQLLTTPLALRASRFNSTYAPFSESIAAAVETGAIYSASLPLTSSQTVNKFGQIYQGPVVLITDAVSYSATDTLAASFQDNGVGRILGVHRTTGGGGATVWNYSDVLQYAAGPGVEISALPKGASFRVAFSRNTRVKRRADVPIEDFGVTADFTHDMTRNDVINTENPNEDLIKHAISLLEEMPRHSLTASTQRTDHDNVTVTAMWHQIDRIDAYVDGRPGTSMMVTTSPTVFTLSGISEGQHQLTLNGFVGTQLLAATRVATT